MRTVWTKERRDTYDTLCLHLSQYFVWKFYANKVIAIFKYFPSFHWPICILHASKYLSTCHRACWLSSSCVKFSRRTMQQSMLSQLCKLLCGLTGVRFISSTIAGDPSMEQSVGHLTCFCNYFDTDRSNGSITLTYLQPRNRKID